VSALKRAHLRVVPVDHARLGVVRLLKLSLSLELSLLALQQLQLVEFPRRGVDGELVARMLVDLGRLAGGVCDVYDVVVVGVLVAGGGEAVLVVGCRLGWLLVRLEALEEAAAPEKARQAEQECHTRHHGQRDHAQLELVEQAGPLVGVGYCVDLEMAKMRHSILIIN